MWSIFLYVVCLLYILDEVFLFKHFAQFLIGLFVSLLISTYLYILDDNILSDTSFINISSSLCLLFSLFLTVYFAEQKFLILMTSNYVVVQSLSCVQLFATPWTAAQQVSLSFTVAQSLLKFISIESVMPSNHLILCFPLLLLLSIFPSIRVFLFQGLCSLHQVAKGLEFQHQSFQWIFRVDFFLGLTDLLSLLSKGLSRIFSIATV